METKNPHCVDVGFSLDAFDSGITNSSNSTTANNSCKRRCGSKNPPHANEMNNDAKLTHVYVGDDALKRVAEAYYWTPDDFPVAAMALESNRSAFEFNWPVNNRTVVILSLGDCDEIVNELGRALLVCGAFEVIGTINNETVKWTQPHRQRMVA